MRISQQAMLMALRDEIDTMIKIGTTDDAWALAFVRTADGGRTSFMAYGEVEPTIENARARIVETFAAAPPRALTDLKALVSP